VGGGFISDGAQNAATLVAATRPRANTLRGTPRILATASSEASNQGRTGFGTTPPTSSTKARHWRILNITLSISPHLDQLVACLAIGKAIFTKAHEGSERR